MNNHTYSRIIESIYDAALNTQQWCDAITLIRDEFHSLAAGFFVEHSHQLKEFLFVGIEDQQIEIYGEHFATINPWYTVPGLMSAGSVQTDQSLEYLHKDQRAFLKTEMYQDWCRQQDFRHALGSNLVDTSGSKINFTFFRSEQAGHYSDSEVARYKSLSRHLLKAVELNAKVQESFEESRLKAHALDSLRIGVVLLDSDKRVVFINSYAEKFFKPGQGLALKSSRLSAPHPTNADVLAQALDACYLHGHSATLLISRAGESSLSVSVVPETSRRSILGLSRMSVAVFISDPDDRDISSSDYLQSRWRLTPQEACFCLHLLQGRTIVEIALRMELTLNTTEWYAKQVREKLGVKRQSAIVALLLRDVGFFLRQ